MANDEPKKGALTSIPFGSKEHAALLSSGYGMTVEEAKEVVAAWEKNPQTYPWEMVQKARALLAQTSQKPAVIDPTPGWKRPRNG